MRTKKAHPEFIIVTNPRCRLSLRLLQSFHLRFSVPKSLAVHVSLHFFRDAVKLNPRQSTQKQLRILLVRNDQRFVLAVVTLIPSRVLEGARVDGLIGQKPTWEERWDTRVRDMRYLDLSIMDALTCTLCFLFQSGFNGCPFCSGINIVL